MVKSKIISGLTVSLAILICTFPNVSDAEIRVYDNGNQYLGILLNIESPLYMTVFIPSINATYRFFETGMNNLGCSFSNPPLLFESQNCSGIPYLWGSFPRVSYYNCPPLAPGYYMPDTNSPGQFLPKSILTGDTNGNPVCNENVGGAIGDLYEAKKIQLPFTTPIVLPVRFEENVPNTADFFVIPVKKK